MKKKNFSQKSILCFWLIVPILLIETNIYSQNLSDIHHETIDDAYISVPRISMRKGPAYNVFNNGYFTTQVKY